MKGKYIRTDEIKRKLSEAHKGKHTNIETEFKNGQKAWNKGKHCSEETKERIRLAHEGKITWMKGKHHTEETKKKISLTKIGTNNPNYGKHQSKETKQKLSLKHKKNWQNEDYAKKMFKSFTIKPNKPEIFLTNLLQSNFPNRFHYVGDGKLIIGGKCPDFTCNPEKKVILLHGDYWHLKRFKNPFLTREIVEKQDIEHYKNNFYGCLIIWEHELRNPNQVINKVQEFLK
ncbi:MAG: hypothetical protein KKD44_27460 [Proteobacteria bacterium]|nr:hypothetical protein [Pseudomonadota bacterium]